MSEQNTAHGDPMPDRPHPLEDLLEPGSRYHAAAADHALTSAAISLKRIADQLDNLATKVDATSDGPGWNFRNAIISLAHEAGMAFQSGTRR